MSDSIEDWYHYKPEELSICPSVREINEMRQEAEDNLNFGRGTAFDLNTYEHGIIATLDWLFKGESSPLGPERRILEIR